MGIDFNNLIKNLGQAAANMQNDKSKIDTKTELNTYVSGWDAIKAKAEAESSANSEAKIDISSLEGEMKSELASLMGAEFGKSAGVQNKGDVQKPLFSEDEISLENMMALLAPEDGMDIDKLREYNKKPMLSAASESVDALTDAGFDSELVEIMVESTPGAVKYISDAIKSGSAKRIGDDVAGFEKDIDAAKKIMEGMKELLADDVKDYTARMQKPEMTLKQLTAKHNEKMEKLSKLHKAASSPEVRDLVSAEMIKEEIDYDTQKTRLEVMEEMDEMTKFKEEDINN